MVPNVILNVAATLGAVLAFVFYSSPSSWLACIVVWATRIVTVSLLLRTYIIPGIVAKALRHIRFQSISFRSIRGLYIRRGPLTVRIERVGYAWRTAERRFAIIVDGLALDVYPSPTPTESTNTPAAPPTLRHRRSRALSNLSRAPSRAWDVAYALFALVNPLLRPFFRQIALYVFSQVINRLPKITRALSFEIHSAEVNFVKRGGTKLVCEEATCHLAIAFEWKRVSAERPKEGRQESDSVPRKSYSFDAWGKRAKGSFERTWRTATERRRRSHLSVNIELQGIKALADVEGNLVEALEIPASLGIDVALSFAPTIRIRNIEPHSLNINISLDQVHAHFEALQSLMKALKARKSASRESTTMAPRSFAAVVNAAIPPRPLRSRSSSFARLLSPSGPDVSGLPSSASNKSPLWSSLSSSILARRYPFQQGKKLSQFSNKGTLSILKLGRFTAGTITFSIGQTRRPLKAQIQELVLEAGLSSPHKSSVHRKWLGQAIPQDQLEPEIYSGQMYVEAVQMFGGQVDPKELLRVGPSSFELLTAGWPAPWLISTPFIGGDPNAPLFASSVHISGVKITDDLHALLALADDLKSRSPSSLSKSHRQRSDVELMPLPRVIFELRCGPVNMSLRAHHADQGGFELRTDGLEANVDTQYNAGCFSKTSNPRDDFDLLPIRMSLITGFSMKPLFVRARPVLSSRSSGLLLSTETAYTEDPALLLVETFEISVRGHAMAEMKDDTQSVASVQTSSLTADIACTSDVCAIELWNPFVGSTFKSFLDIAGTRQAPRSDPKREHEGAFSTPPKGLNILFSLGRFVLLVTASDINRDIGLESVTRGAALCTTGLAVQYSALHLSQCNAYPSIEDRCNNRRKLGLPLEIVAEAIQAAKTENVGKPAVLGAASWSNLTCRSAVATPHVPDDPFISETDDPLQAKNVFLSIPHLRLKANFAEPLEDSISATCSISLFVPQATLTFRLAHVYSILLAISALKGFIPVRSAQKSAETRVSSRSIILSFRGEARTMDLSIFLPKEKVTARIHTLSFDLPSTNGGVVQVDNVVLWVPSLTGEKEIWEELLSIRDLQVSTVSGQPQLDMEALRLRIPYGYIFADLVLNIGITVKAARHLVRSVQRGHLTGMSSPGAEGPKKVPPMKVNVALLCVELADNEFESHLGLVWHVSKESNSIRSRREHAFQLKVEAIHSSESSKQSSQENTPYEFSADHTVSIEQARERLDRVHELDHRQRFERARDERIGAAQSMTGKFRGHHMHLPGQRIARPPIGPPLFRAQGTNVSVAISSPSFAMESLTNFLHVQGGLPANTAFSLLVPLHLNVSLTSLRVAVRDYPIPLIDVPSIQPDTATPSLVFDTDLVVAEEMGTSSSVDWIACPIISEEDSYGSTPLSLSVPKTIMPVKTYANPDVQLLTPGATTFSWAVSYASAIQDIMRVVETLSHAPRDPSPSVGFWDKLRLVLHWSVKASFKGDIHYYMKGLRDPYTTLGEGAGFVMVWQGNPKLLINRKNDDGEIIQLISDTTLIAVPRIEKQFDLAKPGGSSTASTNTPFAKVWAKFRGGVRFGVGIALERSCSSSCPKCEGTAFHRDCRIFTFKPHHEVLLEKKAIKPEAHSEDDSYADFRSDFIHMSISIQSGIRPSKPGRTLLNSSFHLTPQTFKHFWSWCRQFNGALSIPIRQGSRYPRRPKTPKFGRHLATIKYRMVVPRLFLMHGYLDDSRSTWADGLTPLTGVKAMIDEFQVDMHQRELEVIVPGLTPDSPSRTVRRKPFYAAELVIRTLDLRAIMAVFKEPAKRSVSMEVPSAEQRNYMNWTDLPVEDESSPWIDNDDFVELGWLPTERPSVHILPIMTCPRVVYFKRNAANQDSDKYKSKFGNEETHKCLLGTEPSASKVQMDLTLARIAELQDSAPQSNSAYKMIQLLEGYLEVLQKSEQDDAESPAAEDPRHYQLPSDTITADEWAEFDNVFHIHNPKILLDDAIRDASIMLQYYESSRAWRGLEYHLSARAIQFIRDQAREIQLTAGKEESKKAGHFNTAQAAAFALRKILLGEERQISSVVEEAAEPTKKTALDPMSGWSHGVSLRKSYCCLLMKPQIALRSRGDGEERCVLAAQQAKLQLFEIMDDANVDDPINGKVMTRTYALLSGLQTFAPASASVADTFVPLEVLIDFRCESDLFERLVPQTDATLHYDKFNRLRLRSNLASTVARSSSDSGPMNENHLSDQTDLMQIDIPRFTVTANSIHYQIISKIVTKLLLFSNPSHKTQLDQLESLVYLYDFTDLNAMADVIAQMQTRLRSALHMERQAMRGVPALNVSSRKEILSLRAHIFLSAEQLNQLFDAIKLTQDRMEGQADRKSAMLVNASSSQISWNMLDMNGDLLAKLVVSEISHYWLSRQDSSTVNNLSVGNLQAFDGSHDAEWAEILSKFDEPANHAMAKKGLFLQANWSILPPVGGIVIYEYFDLNLHPLRLQLDGKVGRRIMRYVWPGRQEDDEGEGEGDWPSEDWPIHLPPPSMPPSRASVDSAPMLLPPNQPLRRLGTSRSFSDVRAAASSPPNPPALTRTKSSGALRKQATKREDISDTRLIKPSRSNTAVTEKEPRPKQTDAVEMRSRSSQKTFVYVRITSLNLCLSVRKEESFIMRDAKIRTRDLEYRNQTWSFEELVNQFIPSDMSWKGWVKMALHQPLVPVLPVARELFHKTKRIAATKSRKSIEGTHGAELSRPQTPSGTNGNRTLLARRESDEHGTLRPESRTSSHLRTWKQTSHRRPAQNPGVISVSGMPFTAEPESVLSSEELPARHSPRHRMLSLFSRSWSNQSGSDSGPSRDSNDKDKGHS